MTSTCSCWASCSIFLATAHYRVEKEEREGRVVAVARRLDERERVAEIARMLAGEKVGGSALTHAEELLRGS
jgi:DNA repair protein RecN (Recombination protein N)